MTTTQETQTTTGEKIPLPWSRSWRKVYKTRAIELGYNCAWHGGQLTLQSQTGKNLFHFTPKSKIFFLEDIIAEFKTDQEKKRIEREEKDAEICSRIAAGEPLFLLAQIRRRNQREYSPRGNSGFLSLMLPALLMGSMGGLPRNFRF